MNGVRGRNILQPNLWRFPSKKLTTSSFMPWSSWTSSGSVATKQFMKQSSTDSIQTASLIQKIRLEHFQAWDNLSMRPSHTSLWSPPPDNYVKLHFDLAIRSSWNASKRRITKVLVCVSANRLLLLLFPCYGRSPVFSAKGLRLNPARLPGFSRTKYGTVETHGVSSSSERAGVPRWAR